MAVEIPVVVPNEVRAGDTVKFRRELSDYPASAGWVLSYQLINSTTAHSFTATADGDVHAVTVAAATTATWAAGDYKIHETVALAGERYTLAVKVVRVLPDLAAAATADIRTHARKVLDAIEAWLEAKAPTAASFEVAGRKLAQYPLPELLALRDRYRAEVTREQRTEAGRPPVRLLTRFTR